MLRGKPGNRPNNQTEAPSLIRPIESRLPAIYMEIDFVAVGYGLNFTELFRRAAAYVDKILRVCPEISVRITKFSEHEPN
jgi:hypothetical protein